MSRGDDADFFIKLARANRDGNESQAALVALESAIERRPTPDQLAAIATLAEEVAAKLAVDEPGGARARSLAVRARSSTPERNAPPPSPPQPSPRPSESSLEILRRLLVSPEVAARLDALVAPRVRDRASGKAPLSLPADWVVTRLLAASLDARKIAELALDLVVKATRAERGFIVIGGDPESAFGAAGEPPPRTSVGIFEEVLTKRATALVADTTTDARFARRPSVAEIGPRTVLCVPIEAEDAPLGAIYIDADPAARGAFGSDERELAELLASTIAPALASALRFEERGAELARTRRVFLESSGSEPHEKLIGRSPAMQRLLRTIEKVAPGTHTVLIHGESGTGKELVARAIHARSDRARGPFIAENVGALTESLLEAELFGHVKGAFTGAAEARPGLFVLASGGTLFLDEVAEMSEALQRKLLRVLQEREVRPVGGSSPIKVDARIIAATHRDLKQLVAEGTFREDLYYRLSVVPVSVPPLRERAEDIPLLLGEFLERAVAAQGSPVPRVPDVVLDRLARHSWPGNVRELEGYAVRLLLEGPNAPLGDPTPERGPLAIDLRLAEKAIVPMREARAAFERAYVALVLDRCGGNMGEAAKALGMNRSYFSVFVRRFGLRGPTA